MLLPACPASKPSIPPTPASLQGSGSRHIRLLLDLNFVCFLLQVLATGGCSSVTSRADLLPCTCGGGGTIYSSFHKKLFVHNRLQTAVVSAASPFSRASPPPGSLASGADEPAKKRETGAGEGAEDRRESAAVGEGAGAAGDATEGPPPAGAGVTGGQEAAATPEAAARPAASAARGEGGHASRSSVAAPQPNVVLSLTEVTSFQPTVLPGCLFAPFLNVEIDSAVAVLPATTRCEWRGRPGKNRKNGLRRRGDSARDPSGQTASWSAGDRRRRSGGGLGDRDELDTPSAGERQRELERAAEALAAGAEEASEAGGENVAPVDMQRRRGATGGMPPARDEGDSEGTGTGSQRSTGNHERPEMPAGPKAQGNQRTSTDDKQTGAQPGTAERRSEDAETLGTSVTKNAATEFDDTATPTETCGDKAAAGDAQRPRRATEEEAREPASSAALPATAPAAEPVVDEERETRREKVATEEVLAYASDTKVAMSQCGGENNRHEGQEDSKNAGTQEGSSEERRQTSHHRAEGDDEGDTLGERAEVLGDPELPSGDLVVVGTLLLHGGANGASLRVLQPLHLHAASGSVRLRQQSKLVFARLSVSSTAANADPRGHRRGGQATFSFCPGHEDPLDQADESHASPSAVSSPPAPLSSEPFSSFPASCRAPSVDLNFPILSASGSVQIDTSASVLFSPFLSVRGDDMSGGTSPFPASSALAAGAALALTPPSGAVFAEGELIIHGSVRASLPSAAFAASRGAGASRSVAPPVLVPLFPPPPVLAYGQVGVTLGDDVQRLQNMILFSEGVVRIHSRQESASEEEEEHRCDLRAQRQPANPCDAMDSFLHAFLSPAVAALKTLGDADPQVAKPRKSERERSELTPRPPRDMQGRKADQTPQTIGDRTEERGAAGGGTAASPHAPDCQAGSPAASPSGRRKKQAASAHRVLASDMPLAGSAPEACARSPLAGPSACGREEGDLEDSTHGGGGEDDRAHDARNGDAGRGSRGGLAPREAPGEPARWLHMQRRLAELAAHFLSALSLDYAVRVPVDRPKDPGDAEKAVGGAPTAYPSESRSASASEREAETNGDCGPPAETDRHCNANRKDMLGHVEDENCPPAGEASDLEQHAGDEVERLSAGNEAPPGSERANRPWEQATDSVDEAKPGSTNTADGDTKEGRREAEGKSREEESADTREEKVQRTGDEGAEPRSPEGSSVDASKAPERPPAADDRPREASAAPGAQPQLDIRLDTEGQVSQVVRHGDGGSDTPQSEEREQPRDAPKHLEGKPEAAGEEACTGEETSLPSREATDPVQRDAGTAGGGSARPGRLTGAGEVGDNMRGPCERRASSGDAGQIGRSAMPVRADSARQQERDVRKEIRNLLSATQPTCRSHQDAPARIRALLRMGNDEDNARSVPRDAVAFWELVEAMNDAGAPRFVPPPLVELLLGRVTLQTETGGEACGGSRSSAASALQDESASSGLLKTVRLDGAAQHLQGARDALAPPPDQGIGSYPLDTNCPLLRPFLPSPPRAPLPHSPSVSLASAAARGRVFALSGRLACGRASHPVPTWTPHGLLTAAWLCRAEQSGRDFDTLNQANVKCEGAADRRRDDGRAERGERAGQAAATGGDVERPPQHRGDVRTQPEQADAALEQRGGEVGGLREAVTKLVELPGSTYQSWDPTWRVESFDEARQGAARQLKARSESRGPETEDEHPGRRRLGAGEAAPQSDPDEDRRNAFSGEVERLCDGAARGAAGTETAETAACQPLVGDASPRAGDCPEQPRALSVLLAAPLYRKQSVRDRCFGKKKHTHNSQHRPTESRLPLPEQGGLSYHPRSQGALGGPRLSAAYPADRWPPLEVVKSLDGLRRAAAFSGPWRPGASPSASPHGSVHLPFDVLVYGHKGVVVAESSRVSGAAVLLCGGTGPVKVEGKVTARARGCKPGEGPGAGSRNPAAPPQPPADVSRSLASAAGERNADPSSPAAAGVRDNRGDAVPSDPETVLDALSSPPSPTVASSSPAFCGAGGGGHVGRGGDGVDPRTGRLCVGTGGRSYDIVANALPASGAQAQARALSQAAMASESQRGRTSPQSPSGHGSGAGKGGPEARAAVGLRRRDTEEVVASSLSGENNGMGASRNSSGEQTAEAAAASEHDIDKTSQTAGDTNVSSGSSAATGATDEATGAPSPHAHPGSPIIPAERLLTRLPTTSASGGGGDPRRSGAGGGLVWLEGFEVEVSGVVEVDGADAEAMQDVPVDDAVRRALIEEEQAKKLEQAHGAAEPEGREASAIREQDLAYAGYRQWQALALPAAIRDVLAYELTMGMVGVLPMHGAARRDQGSAAEEGVDIVRRRGTQKRGLEGLRNWPLKSDAEDIEDLMPDGKAGDSRHPGSVERSGTWLPAFPAGRRDAYQGIHSASELPGWSLSGFAGSFLSKDEDMTSEPESASRGAPRRQAFADNDLGQQVSGAPGLRNNEVTDDGASLTSQAGHLPYDSSSKVSVAASLSGDPLRVPRHPNPGGAGNYIGVDLRMPRDFTSISLPSDEQPLVEKRREKKEERSAAAAYLATALVDPSQAGQGGGAGGSIIVRTYALKGSGLLSARGGKGGRCTGGGGGGGVVGIEWLAERSFATPERGGRGRLPSEEIEHIENSAKAVGNGDQGRRLGDCLQQDAPVLTVVNCTPIPASGHNIDEGEAARHELSVQRQTVDDSESKQSTGSPRSPPGPASPCTACASEAASSQPSRAAQGTDAAHQRVHAVNDTQPQQLSIDPLSGDESNSSTGPAPKAYHGMRTAAFLGSPILAPLLEPSASELGDEILWLSRMHSSPFPVAALADALAKYPLQFAGMFTGRVDVSGGASDDSQVCELLQLPAGQKGFGGQVVALPSSVGDPTSCPAGRAGWQCVPCPLGYFHSPGEGFCRACTNKPEETAVYVDAPWLGGGSTTSRHCPYACLPGLPDVTVNPRCLPPFLFLLETFRTHAFGFGLLFGVLFLAVAFLVKLAQLLDWRYEPSVQFEVTPRLEGPLSVDLHLNNPAASSLAGEPMFESKLISAPIRQRQARSSLVRSCQSPGGGVVPESGTGASPLSAAALGSSTSALLRKTIQERRSVRMSRPYLTMEDLPYHVQRIILFGSNTPVDPWGLDAVPPPFLAPLVVPEHYAAFACHVNALCSYTRGFVFAYSVLRAVYLPAAALLLEAARRRHASQLISFILSLDNTASRRDGPRHAFSRRTSAYQSPFAFWRSIRARELSFGIKVTVSPCLGVCCLDVLDFDRNPFDFHLYPHSPMVILPTDTRMLSPQAPGAERHANASPSPASSRSASTSPRSRRRRGARGFFANCRWRAFWRGFTDEGVSEAGPEGGKAPCDELVFSGGRRHRRGEQAENTGRWRGTGGNRGRNSGRRGGSPFVEALQQIVGRGTIQSTRGCLALSVAVRYACPRSLQPSAIGVYASSTPRARRISLAWTPLALGGGLPDEGDEFLLWRLSPGVAAVFELQDGIRKLSTQFLLPHRLKASLCIFPIEGFVTTGDRCQRLAHLPSEAVGPQKFDAIQAAPPGRNTATSNTVSGNRCGAVSVFLAAADRFARPCALSPYSTSTLRVPWLHQEDAWADGFVAPLESDESSADGRKRLPARSRIPLCGRPASTALTCTTGERASHHRNVGKPETFGSNSVPAGSASFEERASPFSARDRSLPGTARRLGYAGSAGSRSRESFDSPGSGSIPDSRVCSPPPPFTASVNLAGQESARRVRSGFAGLARLLSFTSSGSSSSPPGSCLESSGSPTGSQAPYPLSVTSPPPYQGGQTEPLFTADYSPGPLGAAATSQLTPASMAHYKPVSKYREFPEIAYVAGDTNVSSPHSPMSWLPSWVSSSAPASSSQSQSHAEPSLMAAPDSYPVHAAAGYLKTPDEPSWGSTGRLRVRRLRQNVMALVITELPPAPLPSHGSASGDAAATREDVGLPTLPSLAAPPSAAALTSPLDPSRLHPLNVSAASYVSPSSQRPGAGGRVARDGSRLSPTPSFSLVGRFDRYAGTGTASGGSGHGQSPSPFSGCYTEEQGSRQMSSPHDTGEVVMLPLLSETSVSSSTEGFGDPPQVPDSPRGYAATAGNESDSLDASPCSSPRGTQRRKLPPTVHTGTAVAALKGRQVLVPGGLRCDTSGTPQAVTSPDVLHGEQSHDRECAKVGVAPLAHVPAPGLPDVRDTEAGGHRETSGHWTTVMVERQPWPSAVRDVSQSATRNCGTRRHMYERLPGRNGMGAAATGTAVAAAAIGELRRRLLQSLGGTQAVSYPAPSSGVPRDGTTVPAPVHEALRRTERASYAGLCDLRHAESWTECLRAAVGVDREGVNGDERSHRGASEAGDPTFAFLPYIEEETSSENAWLPLGRWIERAASAAQRRVWKRGQTNAISTILFATFTSLFILHGVATLVQYHTMYHASHPPSSPFSISSRSAAIPPLLSPDAPAPLPFHVPSTLSAASIQSIPVPFPDRLHLLVATLCPPFVEVFAIITGILFMIRGNPQQGKLFLMSLLASVPRHLIGCALRVWERPQYNFIILDLLELVFFLCLKTALLVAGGMCLADVQHQLETADDVSPDGVESIVLVSSSAVRYVVILKQHQNSAHAAGLVSPALILLDAQRL
ncbi:hypothetical protein BESB_021010 [Besnoitia besnoiti]|uniref:Transmembrane protein n=1 Tax=Besnoitia besnoiti TaxID=94643 RepID=A0A2A9M9V3_BESBE|nr:hypothetical protein BESB_021010 [Besnoitia besnoiti]PFH32160.1 hypothetical protein BESB_021010 [Besnoitia besnoiti]